MIQMLAVEARANKLAKRTRNNIPSGWWKTMFRKHELQQLLDTGKWELVTVTGTMQLPRTKPVQVKETFLRKI